MKPSSREKIVQDVVQDTMDKIIDRMKKEGKIPEVVASSFVDPEDDEDLTINSDVMSVFWRLVIPNKRLIDIVAEEPSITKLGLMARNNAAGCWIAFTSKKIAKRIADSLITKNIVVDCHLCDKKGNINGNNINVNGSNRVGALFPDDRNNNHTNTIETKIRVEEWRPWKKSGDKTENPYRAEEFFYCLTVYSDMIKVYFVPESYWNENRKIFKGSLNIDSLIKSYLTLTDKSYCYTSTRSELNVQAELFQSGFRENLLLNAYINENEL
jgi:hypothetical protein